MTSFVMQMAGAVTADTTGVLFLASAGSKALDIPRFASDIAAYRLIPLDLAFPVAYGLIAIQAALGAWLWSGWLAAMAGIVASLLLLFFAFVMGINVARGRTTLSCGCLPGSNSQLSWRAVGRNIGLALMVLLTGFLPRPSGAFLNAEALLAGISILLIALASVHLRQPEQHI
ncbi:MauE/DoxX family redox-associated membrane protein [Gluconobacter frateurii]|uniref:Methylamine utilization protein MauE n=1 Tax=Gluconobacter frateurii NRIC 0228 TaxID=1307946 RepID=A0ABQ0QFH2_9PROT|nr:MauE/DoxX family redox-associated membrane protein [Gluconobacter frateurii]GBR17126.1 hypothetical protein AA0228_2954 [Gluconobacter frateurii NRIC 0228]GLP90753.1 hypothetical protein GCM10007868_18280 [Gluconobacter frateurii]